MQTAPKDVLETGAACFGCLGFTSVLKTAQATGQATPIPCYGRWAVVVLQDPIQHACDHVFMDLAWLP